MSTCVFCQIAANLLPSIRIHETESLICLLPLEMEVKGHTLVVTKQHYADLREIPPVLGAEIFAVIQKMARHYAKALGATGFNILNANDASAQQSVPHLHFHYIPRVAGDGVDSWPRFPQYDGDKAALAKLLQF